MWWRASGEGAMATATWCPRARNVTRRRGSGGPRIFSAGSAARGVRAQANSADVFARWRSSPQESFGLRSGEARGAHNPRFPVREMRERAGSGGYSARDEWVATCFDRLVNEKIKVPG